MWFLVLVPWRGDFLFEAGRGLCRAWVYYADLRLLCWDIALVLGNKKTPFWGGFCSDWIAFCGSSASLECFFMQKYL